MRPERLQERVSKHSFGRLPERLPECCAPSHVSRMPNDVSFLLFRLVEEEGGEELWRIRNDVGCLLSRCVEEQGREEQWGIRNDAGCLLCRSVEEEGKEENGDLATMQAACCACAWNDANEPGCGAGCGDRPGAESTAEGQATQGRGVLSAA